MLALICNNIHLKKVKINKFLGLDLQAWDIYVPFGFFPNINIHKNIGCHLKT